MPEYFSLFWIESIHTLIPTHIYVCIFAHKYSEKQPHGLAGTTYKPRTVPPLHCPILNDILLYIQAKILSLASSICTYIFTIFWSVVLF